jgi:Gpi18-like mannosyltransferase
MTAASVDRWTRLHWLTLGVVVVVGITVRLALLPGAGLTGDLDQFVGWVRHIATNGLATLYSGTDAGPVTFGPVMAYIWSLLAAIHPAFATAIDSSDPAIRVLMKAPASIADFGLAAVAAYALRERPRWAVLAAGAILLHPAVFYVSAWWGQYESIFVLSARAAVVAATRGRNGIAAALIAVSLMTKPQAIPFLIPFAAWFWASGGWRELARSALIGLADIVVLWLPFLATGGPTGYLRNLGTYQNEIFNVLSLRAWNPWWLLQEAAAGGDFIRDDVAFAGPLTLRHLGYAVTAVLSLAIGWAILRDPRPRTLIVGLVASVLVVFTFMTQMHERYAYAALPLLTLAMPDLRLRWLWLMLSIVVTLNLLAAVPPTAEVGRLMPIGGVLGLAGSLLLTGCTALALYLARRRSNLPSPA